MSNEKLLASDANPDDTGPFVCECCSATHDGPSEAAIAADWVFTWDGYVCPSCVVKLSEDE